MSRKFKGFTIAELLISLLIISLVLSAAIPTITRKKAGNEAIWQWSESTNSAYFVGLGENNSIIIGNTYKPDGTVLTNFDEQTQGLLTDNKFVNSNDKLILIKKDSDNSDLQSSHISFYTIGSDGTTASVKYTGRLVLDQQNVALGLASMANSENPCSESSCAIGNTAIGHYSLVANENGQYNTAIGTKTLVNNIASFNTAVGAYSGFYSEDANAGLNTGVGAYSLANNKQGKENTAIGYKALFNTGDNDEGVSNMGNSNTAIGTEACSHLKGNKNICIGYNSGNAVHLGQDGASDFATRYAIGQNTDDFLFIGTYAVPLIAGRMNVAAANTENAERQVIFNTNDLDVNTPSGKYTGLNVNIKEGTSGTAAKLTLKTIQSSSHNATLTVFSDQNNPERLYINTIADNADGQIWFNDGAIKLIDSSNSDGYYVAINTKPRNGKYDTMLLDEGRIELNSTGKTVLRNGNGATGLGSAFLTISNDNSIDLGYAVHVANATSTGGNIDLKGDTLNVQMKSTYNGIATFKAQTTFENASAIFKKDPQIAGVKDAGGLNGVADLGVPNTPKATGDGLLQGLYALWKGIADNRQGLITLLSRIGSSSSDARLKNITGNSTAGLKEINKIQVKNFTFKKDKEKKPHVGVIAQELQKVFPNSVFKGDDGYLRVNNDEMFFAMINSIKELFAKIQDLTAKVTGLDNRLKKLEQENAQLKKQNADFEARLKKLEAKSK